MKPCRRTTKASRNARPAGGHASRPRGPVRRHRSPRSDWKQRARGIYAQPKATRATLDKCLDDRNRNWPLVEIAAHMLKKHGYKMSAQAVSEYRRKRIAKTQPAALGEAGPLSEITLQIAAPAGTRIKIVRAK